MADFNKLFKKMQSLEPAREERDYIKEPGKHVCKIVSCIEKTAQNGKDLVIIEYSVINSDVYDKGDGLKQIFALSNEQDWRIGQNLQLIQALISSAIPGIELTQEVFETSVSGGVMSPLAGRPVVVVATKKVPQKDRLVSLSTEYVGWVVSEDVESLTSDDILLKAKVELTASIISDLMNQGVKKVRVLKPYISFSYRVAEFDEAEMGSNQNNQIEDSSNDAEEEDDVPFDI